jgi:hypothetical protein
VIIGSQEIADAAVIYAGSEESYEEKHGLSFVENRSEDSLGGSFD